MRCAVYCANFGSFADPAVVVELAQRAEAAGWDGFFLYDHILVRDAPTADPWVTLGAVAARTERIMLGPLVVPVARRAPWELAHQVATLDRLAGPGRVVLGVGRGMVAEFQAFGDRPDTRTVGARLDEGIGLVARLLAGEAVDHDGTWALHGARLAGTPVAVPIWVGGTHDKPGTLKRAARHDGAFLIGERWHATATLTPAQVAAVAAATGARDVVHAGVSPLDPEPARARAGAYARAGATWWLEVVQDGFDPSRTTLADHRRRIDAGPPRPAG